MKVRAHVTFRGRVQGVYFRANASKRAEQAGLTGWVRNLPDGAVEAVFEGEVRSVKDVIAWCRGNQPLARVDHVEMEWEEYRGEFSGFAIRY